MSRAGLAALGLLAACASTPRSPGLSVVDGELRLRMAYGRTLRTHDLIGATIDTTAYSVRVDGAHRERDRVWLYTLTVVGSGSDLCAPDARGERWALPVVDDTGAVSFACTSGAVGKCILFGYPPDAPGHLHQACVRMVRADYGGDGASFTRDGMVIRFCDRLGVHPCGNVPELEAAWSERGAVCLNRTRVPELATRDQIAERYARLAPAACGASADAPLLQW